MLSSALTLLSKGSFGIILLDLSLPDGKGLDTVSTHACCCAECTHCGDERFG